MQWATLLLDAHYRDLYAPSCYDLSACAATIKNGMFALAFRLVHSRSHVLGIYHRQVMLCSAEDACESILTNFSGSVAGH